MKQCTGELNIIKRPRRIRKKRTKVDDGRIISLVKKISFTTKTQVKNTLEKVGGQRRDAFMNVNAASSKTTFKNRMSENVKKVPQVLASDSLSRWNQVKLLLEEWKEEEEGTADDPKHLIMCHSWHEHVIGPLNGDNLSLCLYLFYLIFVLAQSVHCSVALNFRLQLPGWTLPLCHITAENHKFIVLKPSSTNPPVCRWNSRLLQWGKRRSCSCWFTTQGQIHHTLTTAPPKCISARVQVRVC